MIVIANAHAVDSFLFIHLRDVDLFDSEDDSFLSGDYHSEYHSSYRRRVMEKKRDTRSASAASFTSYTSNPV